MFNKVSIIGCGLIGSSILRDIEEKKIYNRDGQRNMEINTVAKEGQRWIDKLVPALPKAWGIINTKTSVFRREPAGRQGFDGLKKNRLASQLSWQKL